MNIDITKILEEVGRLHMQVTAQIQFINQLKAEIENLKSKSVPPPAVT